MHAQIYRKHNYHWTQKTNEEMSGEQHNSIKIFCLHVKKVFLISDSFQIYNYQHYYA